MPSKKKPRAKSPKRRARRSPIALKPREPARMGRPTELTPEVQEQILEVLHDGLTLQDAAAIARVARPTLFGWLARGRAEESTIYADFSDAVQAEISGFKQRMVRRILGAGSHRADMQLLERRFPDEFAKRPRRSFADPDAPAYGGDATTELLDRVRSLALAGDQDALADVIGQAISYGAVLTLERMREMTPGQLPQVLLGVAKVQEKQGGAKLRHTMLNVFLGGPEDEEDPTPAEPKAG